MDGDVGSFFTDRDGEVERIGSGLAGAEKLSGDVLTIGLLLSVGCLPGERQQMAVVGSCRFVFARPDDTEYSGQGTAGLFRSGSRKGQAEGGG